MAATKSRSEIRDLAHEIARDCIVTDALARLLEQVVEAVVSGHDAPHLKKLAKDTRALMAIHLVREGDFAVVKVECAGRWVEVIREHVDGPFSHIVEPSGIEAAVARATVAA